jgi:CheY-like chemotaxis protein
MLDYRAQRDLPTILLIDDDPISREVMATVLTMGGYTVHTAIDGSSALQMLVDEVCIPGIILMDAQMPGLGGVQLIKQIRARSSASLYAISGSNPPKQIVAATDGFLLKPFTPDDLRSLQEKRPPSPAKSPTKKSKNSPPARTTSSPKLESGVPSDRSSSLGWSDTPLPVIDPEILAQLREMMSEAAVRQIYAAIVADLARRIAAIETAIAQKNVAEIHRIGHNIKGGCGMAGARQAASLGAAFESIGNQLDNSPALLENLRDAARTLERMLEVEFPA